MTLGLPIAFDFPRTGIIAIAVLIFILIALFRHPRLRLRPKLFFAAGSILLALAAAGPVFQHPVTGTVAVLVDLSPSTRGATFRSRAALNDWIAKLLGKTSFQILAFSDRITQLPPGDTLPDLSCDRTLLTLPPADAIVLFSDGQFPAPKGLPPTYPVIDPALNAPADSAVTQLECFSHLATATIHQPDKTHPGRWTGAIPTADALTAIPTADEIRFTLAPGDLWPENDTLTIRRPQPYHAARWWVGDSAPPGWIARNPSQLPTDPADYLGPAVVVLNDISAESLSTAQQDALSHFVRDFGGGLVIVGGPHAYAAGAYDRTALDQLSPLAGTPPDAAARWVILVDGSGSMSSTVPGGSTAWQTEAAAARAITAALPAADRVTVGSFAAGITPWITDTPAGQLDPAKIPPPGVGPHGPTNLQSALESFANTDSPLSTRVLLMTDADAALADPDKLAAQLRDRHVSLSILATGDGPALPALRAIAAATGGSVIEQPEPTKWITAARALANAARPDGLRTEPVAVTLMPPLQGTITVSPWNPTWPRDRSQPAAKSPDRTMAATWTAGLGKVTALAWQADPGLVETLARSVAAPPADPRLKVTVDPGRNLQISVDAVDGATYLTNLHITATLDDSPATAVPQTAPGRYTISLPAPRDPSILTVYADARVIARLPIAGRYPPEFDGIGNDLPALQALAARTGGQVIDPGPVSPIDFHWPTRSVLLFTPLTVTAAAMLSLGLIAWRRQPPSSP